MEPCALKAESISLLVQEQILPEAVAAEWVSQWPSECGLEEGAIIRIPYNPDEIASIVRERTADATPPVDEPTPLDGTPSDGEPPPDENHEPSNMENPMPQETEDQPETTEPAELNAHEVQPSDPTGGLAGEFNELAKTTGQDPTLTILLALLAVVGGGAAWKFYRQHSEQKHEQKMVQMKMEAKEKGMGGQSPGPCQAVHAQMKAEIEEMKSRLDKTAKKLSLNADFDGDDIERKVRKLEKWRKSLEEEDDE